MLDDILNKIENAVYKPGDMIPTENELTVLYNVSRTTVQKALNILASKGIIYRVAGKGTFVSEKECPANVAPNDVFSIVLPYKSQITVYYLNGAQSYMDKYNSKLSVHFTENSYESEIHIVDRLVKSNCAGIILYPNESMDKEGFYRNLANRKIPVITIDKQIVGASFSSVTANNYSGGYSVAEYFLSKGHHEFAFFSHSFKIGNSLLDRYRGFTDCLKNHNLSLKKENTIVDLQHIPNGDICSFIKNYFIKHKSNIPSAIFCTSDDVASLVYRAAYELDLKIPETFSVIGYDNLNIAAMISPTLTTIEQPYYEIGRSAAKLLLEKYMSPSEVITHIELPIKLIERNSVFNYQNNAHDNKSNI